MPQMPNEAADGDPLAKEPQPQSKGARAGLANVAYEVQFILLVAALYVGLILIHVVPNIAYFIGATLGAIALLALGFVMDRRQPDPAVARAIALMQIVWLAFALHYSEGLNSPLLPLVYVVVIAYTIQRDAPQIGLVLCGAVAALATRLLVADAGNSVALLTVGGHAVLLTATSWAVSRYMVPLYRAHDDAAREAAKYKLMTESSEDALVVLDAEWKVLDLNAAAEEMLLDGCGPDLVGHSLLDLLQVTNPDWIEPYQKQVAEAETISHLPLTVTGQQGEQRSLLLSAMPDFADGELATIQATIRDVTQLQDFRQQIKHLEKFAAVRHVLAGVGHSLNNPLAVIRMGIQVPLTLDKEPDWHEIIRQVDRCATLVRGLEIYTAGRRERCFVTDLNEVLDQAMLLTNSQLMMTGVEFELDVPPKLPLVLADPQSIQRGFINIITNAWEAMEDWPGARKLTIEARRLAESVEISFRDTGPGIAPEEIPHVFKAAYTTKKDGEGVGLGLPMVYEAVREVGGRVVVSPNRRQGGTLVKTILRLASGADLEQYERSARRVNV